jgi:hypothetical protein
LLGPLIDHRLAIIAIAALAFRAPALGQSRTAPATAETSASNSAARNEVAPLYRNSAFGFRYQIPYGWVNRTQEMSAPETPSELPANDAGTRDARKPSTAGKPALLLAVFERPPEATADTVNSAVVIASESAASYPGFHKAEDYLGPLTELATAKGFQAEGDPYALEVESRQLLRADFIKPRNDKVTMHQCTLVLLAKGQIVSFTFIAGSETELDDLMDGLHFSVTKSPGH